MIVSKGKLKLAQVSFKGDGLKDTFVVDIETARGMVAELNDKAGNGTTTDTQAPVLTVPARKRGRKPKAIAEAEAAWPQG